MTDTAYAAVVTNTVIAGNRRGLLHAAIEDGRGHAATRTAHVHSDERRQRASANCLAMVVACATRGRKPKRSKTDVTVLVLRRSDIGLVLAPALPHESDAWIQASNGDGWGPGRAAPRL